MKYDNVNHPAHYDANGLECFDTMIAIFGEEVVMHFCLCNAYKYIFRSRKKNGLEDIQKAKWYLNRYIILKNKAPHNPEPKGCGLTVKEQKYVANDALAVKETQELIYKDTDSAKKEVQEKSVKSAVDILVERIPSAQPEPLTDKEQRIFLAAMEREEKICKKTDEECRNCRESYEDSLVWVCKEIVRKVKGALWQT